MRFANVAWDVLPSDPERAAMLAKACGVDPLIGQLLLNRGVSHPTEARHFLAPDFQALDDPLKLPEMAKAVARIRKAIKTTQPILVFGDADVDGVTASALVYELLTTLARPGKSKRRAGGAKVIVRLSNRLEDGYGFPRALIRPLIRLGIRLLILVDCGTNQPEEIEALARHGIETIVLDHHVPTPQAARPFALVNPAQGSGAGHELCSVGLALKLAQAMCPDDEAGVMRYLDLTVLGTLADHAPLIGDNRILVASGLARILQTPRPGLKQLCEAVAMTKPTPQQILQRLVPRLNAAGRLGNPRPVWRLLVEPSAQIADRLVDVLGEAHAKTKALHRRIQAEAHEQVNRIHFKDQYVVVVGQRGWHPGLMGPLASQLLERYARPAIAIAWDERIGVGSGRSTSVFNLFEALRACEGVLLRYGGHPQACGLTLKLANLETFREQINRHAHAALGRHRLVPRLTIDLELTLREVTTSFVSALEHFKPFGPGNPRPLILLRRLALERNPAGATWVTDGRTTRLRTRGGLAGLLSAERYDVVTSPALVEGRVVLSICDARISSAAQNL